MNKKYTYAVVSKELLLEEEAEKLAAFNDLVNLIMDLIILFLNQEIRNVGSLLLKGEIIEISIPNELIVKELIKQTPKTVQEVINYCKKELFRLISENFFTYSVNDPLNIKFKICINDVFK